MGFKLIGLLTLGSSPREDLMSIISTIIPEKEIILEGALDGLSEEEIMNLSRLPGYYPLFVNTNYGSFTIQREALLPLLTKKADEMHKKGCSHLILLCSGDFEPFPVKIPMMIPARIVEGAIKSVSNGGVIGVIVPVEAQVHAAEKRWKKLGFNPIVVSVNPKEATYSEINQKLKAQSLEQIALDCIGYTPDLQKELKQKYEIPVWLPLTLASRVIMDIHSAIESAKE